MHAAEPHVREPSTAAIALRDDLLFAADVSREPPGYTIEDPLRGKFFRVGVPEYTFLALMDGRRTIAQALGLAAGKLGREALAEHEALALCRWALDCQLAHPAGADPSSRLGEAARKGDRRRLLSRLNPLAVQIPLCRPDRLLGHLSQRLGWVFSPGFFLLWAAVGLYGLYLVATGWTRLAQTVPVILDRDNWLRLTAAWLLLKLLHETAHGLACKRFGGNVAGAGLTLILLFPLAYVDVTSSWRFRSKWQRIMTAAAGMYAELFVAALAIIVWSNTSPGLTHYMALNIAVTAGVSTLLFNGNPLVRFDGYFILSDLLDVPNLYSCAQQYLVDCLQKYVLGREPPLPAWPAGRGRLIRLYAPAALVWRVVFYLTLSLATVGRLSYLGGAIAVGLLALGWGLPLFQIARRAAHTVAAGQVDRSRIAMTAVIASGVLSALAFLLLRPGRVTAPAVVDYAPLTVIRAAAPGFVRETRVASGQKVEAGQVIAVLENKELAAELADLELTLQQSVVRGRMNLQNDELAKRQVEMAQQQSLAKKIAETRWRLDSLVIRAPAAGRVSARDWDSLPGRYLPAGTELAILGQEDVKELVLAISQDDIDLFNARRQATATIDVRARTGDMFAAELNQINPRGSAELPHPALSANVGGPLAVKLVAPSRDGAENAAPTYQLLSPVFQGKAALSLEKSLRLHSGQLTLVHFRTDAEPVAVRWYKSIQSWMTRLTTGPSGS